VTEDTLWEDLVDAATKIIESICNRQFKYLSGGAQTEITEYFNGDGKGKLFLKFYPVASITSIHDDPDRVYGADTLVDSDEYATWLDEGIIEFDGAGTIGSGVKNIKVVYKGGYTDTPFDLELVCWELVAILYKMRDRIGVASKSFSDGSASYFENLLTPQSREVLKRYSKLDH
jgi:hypothetical protein